MKNERIPSAKEKDYQRRVNERMPKSKTLSQCIRAFMPLLALIVEIMTCRERQ